MTACTDSLGLTQFVTDSLANIVDGVVSVANFLVVIIQALKYQVRDEVPEFLQGAFVIFVTCFTTGLKGAIVISEPVFRFLEIFGIHLNTILDNIIYMLDKCGAERLMLPIVTFLNEIAYVVAFLAYRILRKQMYSASELEPQQDLVPKSQLPTVVRCADTWRYRTSGDLLQSTAKGTSEDINHENRFSITLNLDLDFRLMGLVMFTKREFSWEVARALGKRVQRVSCCALAEKRLDGDHNVTCKGYFHKRGGLNQDFKRRYQYCVQTQNGQCTKSRVHSA